MIQKYKLVYIIWADAISATDVWHSKSATLTWGESQNWLVHQVGQIIKKTTDYILLASRYTEDGKDFEEQFGNIFKIPHPWIQSLTELKL